MQTGIGLFTLNQGYYIVYLLSSLVSKLPQQEQSILTTEGYALWLVQQGPLPEPVTQTLLRYGGWSLVEEKDQSLWFFPDGNVLKSLAQVYTWSKVHPLVLSLQVFPVQLHVGQNFSIGLSVDPAVVEQKQSVPREMEILVAPEVGKTLRNLPGLHFHPLLKKESPQKGWSRLQVEIGQDYSSSLSWFLVIKPLGNNLDRKVLDGQRIYFSYLKKLFEQHKVKFLYSEKMETVVYCKTWQTMRQICQEIMQLIAGKDETITTWPCVYLGLEKGQLHFSKELPNKLDVEWDSLESGFLHLPLKTIYQFGLPFTPLGTISPFKGRSELDGLIKTVLGDRNEEEENKTNRLPVFLPEHAQDGDNPPCFYCGLRNHVPQECPSKVLRNLNPGIYDSLAALSLENLQETFEEIDVKLEESDFEGLKNMLQGNDAAAIVLLAFLEINAPGQIRTMRLVWRSRGKDWPRGLKDLSPQEEDASWSALHRFHIGDIPTAASHLNNFMLENPRHYKAKTLQGFIRMEKGQLKSAQHLWKEAEEFCSTSLHRSYHVYLRARAYEVMQEYHAAIKLYEEAIRLSPGMVEAKYRHAACLLKTGFSEQALGLFLELIKDNPMVMNMVLIDPELDRGHLHLITGLWKPWNNAAQEAEVCLKNREKINKNIEQWFPLDHPAHKEFKERLANLLLLKEKTNYVFLIQLARGTAALTKDLQKRVEQEIQEIFRRCKEMYARLEKIQREAAWFPFSKFLGGFNKDFNKCIKELNLVGKLNLYHPDSFQKGHAGMIRASEALERLSGHLKSLVIIRDSTLFMLLFGKHFLWLELICLILSVVILPVLTVWGLKTGQSWGHALDKQQWMVYRVVITVATIFAMGGSAIWTTLRFDKKRKKYLDKNSP